MNRYVVLARFDKNTEEKLIALRREMTNAGYASSEWPPHITLAAYEDLDAEALCDWTGEFVREHTRQKLTFGSVSLLPPYATHRETAVLCLNPVHAKPFVDFYYAFHVTQPLQPAEISATSSGSSAIVGEPPHASVILAQSVAVM